MTLAEVVGALAVVALAAGAIAAAAASASTLALARAERAQRGGGEVQRDAALAGCGPGRAGPAGEERAWQGDWAGVRVSVWRRPGSAGTGAGWTVAPAAAAERTRRALPPAFRFSGVLEDGTFPLRGLLVPHARNPAGTVYRYTVDGSPPGPSSPAWTGAEEFPAWPFPAVVRAAAFAPGLAPSVTVETRLQRRSAIRLERVDGLPHLRFTWAQAEAPAHVHGVRAVLTAPPPGTVVRFAFGNADPSTGTPMDGPIPLAPSRGAPWNPSLRVRVAAQSPAAHVVFVDASWTLLPEAVRLPDPVIQPGGGVILSGSAIHVGVPAAPPGVRVEAAVDAGPYFPVAGAFPLPWQGW
jgi:hypothetical protein